MPRYLSRLGAGMVWLLCACGPDSKPPVDTPGTLPPPEPQADLTRAAEPAAEAEPNSAPQPTGEKGK